MQMSTHLNANVSLDTNANAIFQERVSRICFGVACKCFRYTFANAFELFSEVLALY